jgi:hypothetical protein
MCGLKTTVLVSGSEKTNGLALRRERGTSVDDVDYKGHRLVALTWRNGGKWKPDIHIMDLSRSDGYRIQLPAFGKEYATEKKAEQAGLTFAKKWIDNGKPPIIYEDDYVD